MYAAILPYFTQAFRKLTSHAGRSTLGNDIIRLKFGMIIAISNKISKINK